MPFVLPCSDSVRDGLAGFWDLSLSLLAVAEPTENLSILAPVSPQAASIRDLFLLLLAVTGTIFVIVEGMLLLCIFRFRRRHGDTTEPPQIYGSKPIEVAWTLAPVIIVFVLFMVVFRTSAEVRRVGPPPADALRVRVIGHQWWWEYRYPDLGIITANELHVPVNRPIVFELQSADVIHSFWIPRLAGKTDVVPGRTNTTWFTPEKEDLFLGQCAEYCGTQHANMMLRVVVESAEKFDLWTAEQQKPAIEDPRVNSSRAYFFTLACQNCHNIRGTPAKGTFGPDLTHLMSRQTLVTGMVPNDAANLTIWIDNPDRIKQGCLMPSMHLSKAQVQDVVNYLLTLK